MVHYSFRDFVYDYWPWDRRPWWARYTGPSDYHERPRSGKHRGIHTKRYADGRQRRKAAARRQRVGRR